MLLSKLRNAAGRRRTWVTVEQASDDVANATGEVLPQWTTLCSRWAEAAFTSGREFQAAMQVVPMLNGILKLRYDSLTKTITSRDRIKIGERVLNLSAVFNENEANETIVLWCVET